MHYREVKVTTVLVEIKDDDAVTEVFDKMVKLFKDVDCDIIVQIQNEGKSYAISDP